MSGVIPLIRSGSLLRLVRWLQANGRPVEDILRSVDLTYMLNADSNLPIPLRQALTVLRKASEVEGPDFPARVASGGNVAELGLIGQIALAGGSVGSALHRVAEALPAQNSHATITARTVPNGVMVRQTWLVRMDAETRHFTQQYFAANIQALCANAGAQPPVFERVALVPHPVYGLSHLHRWFGNGIEASPNNTLELLVPARVADLVLPKKRPKPRASAAPIEYPPLSGDGKLTTVLKTIMTSMLASGTPTVERLAAAGGVSVRTLQRRLSEEGTSFSDLLGEVRRDLALEASSTGEQKVGQIAASLGYRQHSSFTRAVRRWIGTSPRTLTGRPRK
jgi:AraC-like DNA-binding protein